MRKPSPLVSGLRLGAAIRDLRGETPATEFIKRAPGVDRVDLTRIETAARKPDHNKVMSCLEAAGVAEDSDTWRTLIRVCRSANEKGWWDLPPYRRMPERQKQAANVESGALWIGWYQNALIPGPLQAPEFVHAREAALASSGVTVSAAAAAGRLRRQKEILHAGGPQIEAILEEQVIRRLIVDPRTMALQLGYLLGLLEQFPQISVRILPVQCALPPGNLPRSPLALHTFEDSTDGVLAFIETVDKDLLLYGPDATNTYVHLFDRMRDATLSREDSIAFITQHSAALAVRA